ncbi:MAG: hypothetical protein MJD61_18310, partial [Proteobacteria bacterium]|nr:hypothetical protein [Pseudomonadota bacterium]
MDNQSVRACMRAWFHARCARFRERRAAHSLRKAPVGPGARARAASLCMAALSVLLWNIEPTPARTQDHKEQEPPLPTRVVIDIDAPDRDLYRIAVPNLLGPAELGAKAAGVLRNDLKLVSLFRVLDSRSFVADLASEALGIVPNAWTVVGAQGVVKGSLKQVGDQVSAEMRLFEPARGHEPVLSRSYRGSVSSLRLFMHQFANELLRVLTGKSGAFHTKLTYARRVGPGRKDVYVADYDGANI